MNYKALYLNAVPLLDEDDAAVQTAFADYLKPPQGEVEELHLNIVAATQTAQDEDFPWGEALEFGYRKYEGR